MTNSSLSQKNPEIYRLMVKFSLKQVGYRNGVAQWDKLELMMRSEEGDVLTEHQVTTGNTLQAV